MLEPCPLKCLSGLVMLLPWPPCLVLGGHGWGDLRIALVQAGAATSVCPQVICWGAGRLLGLLFYLRVTSKDAECFLQDAVLGGT